ncbi:MAG: hypothetical protein JSS81_05650 [Acidobacteria bacterium]|nr:hypothetical protein [Acidobacteriota bacterium]
MNRTNSLNFSIALLILALIALGCTGKNIDADDRDAPKVERGRLKFAKSVKYLNIGDEPVSRDVKQYFFVDGKPWAPVNDPQLAGRINWCDTSPNPAVEILRCFADATESYRTTYVLRIKDGRPDVLRIDEGLPSVWIDDDGRWSLFGKQLVNVETGEKIDLKVIPVARENDDTIPVNFVIGVAPDKKTIVALKGRAAEKKGGEDVVTIRVFDVENGTAANRTVSLAKNPWLLDESERVDDIQPPPSPSKKIVWERDERGRYRPVFQK